MAVFVKWGVIAADFRSNQPLSPVSAGRIAPLSGPITGHSPPIHRLGLSLRLRCISGEESLIWTDKLRVLRNGAFDFPTACKAGFMQKILPLQFPLFKPFEVLIGILVKNQSDLSEIQTPFISIFR